MKNYLNKYSVQKVFSENFYYYDFKSDFGSAKIYFWFFENKVTLDDFDVNQKRMGFGKELFIDLLEFLVQSNVKKLSISSRNTEEAQLFWKKMTNFPYSYHKIENTIDIKNTLKNLNESNCKKKRFAI